MPTEPAARLEDPVQHSFALAGLLAGVLAGAAFGIFVVATGGAGLVVGAAIIGGAVAAGGGLGEVFGSLDALGGWETGGISSGSPDTTTNNKLAARATDDTVNCSGTPPIFYPSHEGKHIATGSGTVLINLQPAARKSDKIECGGKIKQGSPDVIIGGETVQTLEIANEVPAAYHVTLLVVGGASALILAGPVVAVFGFVVSTAGGYGGQLLAAQLGLSEDWQKLFGLAGSFLFGYGGARGGMAANRRLARMPGSNPLQASARRAVAREFYQRNGSTYDRGKKIQRPLTPAEISNNMKGIDFRRPVEVVEAPRQLGSYQAPNGKGRQGNYYAERDVTPNELGIGDYAGGPNGSAPVPKENWAYDIQPGTRALRSTSGPIKDDWSIGKTTPQPTTGGGTQYYLGNKNAATLVPNSGRPLAPNQANPNGPVPGAAPFSTTVGGPPETGQGAIKQAYFRPIWNSGATTANTGVAVTTGNATGAGRP
jgi:uncharacterized Zn-binding protein involved in type VI secretion